jgi:hypothetical protein
MSGVSNVGVEVPLTIAQGTDFSAPLTLYQADGVTPINLTGCTLSAEMKLSAVSTVVYAVFVVTVTNATAGQITVSLPYASNDLPAGDTVQGVEEGTYVWDLKLVNAAGLVSRPFYGTVTVQADVTP